MFPFWCCLSFLASCLLPSCCQSNQPARAKLEVPNRWRENTMKNFNFLPLIQLKPIFLQLKTLLIQHKTIQLLQLLYRHVLPSWPWLLWPHFRNKVSPNQTCLSSFPTLRNLICNCLLLIKEIIVKSTEHHFGRFCRHNMKEWCPDIKDKKRNWKLIT